MFEVHFSGKEIMKKALKEYRKSEPSNNLEDFKKWFFKIYCPRRTEEEKTKLYGLFLIYLAYCIALFSLIL